MIAYVIPTRDRHAELSRTLDAIGRLDAHPRTFAEVIVLDNDSRTPASAPATLPNGVPVRVERLPSNEGAAARNRGVALARPMCQWVVMLDDDSAPIDAGFVERLKRCDPGVGAVSADIFLPDGSRERGGLPEVFIGCGVAIRRGAFHDAGGYDPGFGYYAEEYDLSAKLLIAGKRVVFDPRFRVEHRKVTAGRDMGLILERLMRNNAWVIQRYCPDDELAARLDENERRYGAIARKENALAGYQRGVEEWQRTRDVQIRTPMTRALWDRFTGMSAARTALLHAHLASPFRTAEIVAPGKNAWAVERALDELGVSILERGGEVAVVGTMSPGPMIDAAALFDGGRRVVTPWIDANRCTRPERALAA